MPLWKVEARLVLYMNADEPPGDADIRSALMPLGDADIESLEVEASEEVDTDGRAGKYPAWDQNEAP